MTITLEIQSFRGSIRYDRLINVRTISQVNKGIIYFDYFDVIKRPTKYNIKNIKNMEVEA